MLASSTVPAGNTRWDVILDAWLECSGDPCAEDYEVTISRDPALDLGALDITGSIESVAGGPYEQKEPPPNTEVVVTVTGPM